jgi:hypothetical protein
VIAIRLIDMFLGHGLRRWKVQDGYSMLRRCSLKQAVALRLGYPM